MGVRGHRYTLPYLRRPNGREALVGDGGGRRLIGRGAQPAAVLVERGGLGQGWGQGVVLHYVQYFTSARQSDHAVMV